MKKRLLKNAAARDGNIISAAGAVCSLVCWPTTGLFYEGVVTFSWPTAGRLRPTVAEYWWPYFVRTCAGGGLAKGARAAPGNSGGGETGDRMDGREEVAAGAEWNRAFADRRGVEDGIGRNCGLSGVLFLAFLP